MEEYDVGSLLGKGGFAHVYRCRHRSSGREVALKVITNQTFNPTGEINIHRKCDHPSIINLLDSFSEANSTCIVLECCQSNLYKYLKTNSTIPEPTSAYIVKQILDALHYLHSHHIIHRDIKLSNILISEIHYTRPVNNIDIKVCDFGLASQLQHPDEEHYTLCGTPNYIAPEIVRQEGNSYPGDIWAVGCLNYSLLTGAPPFERQEGAGDDKQNGGDGLHATLRNIVAGVYKIPTSKVSAAGVRFLESLLNQDPVARPSVRQILRSEYMQATPSKEYLKSKALDVDVLNTSLAATTVEPYNQPNQPNQPSANKDMETPVQPRMSAEPDLNTSKSSKSYANLIQSIRALQTKSISTSKAYVHEQLSDLRLSSVLDSCPQTRQSLDASKSIKLVNLSGVLPFVYRNSSTPKSDDKTPRSGSTVIRTDSLLLVLTTLNGTMYRIMLSSSSRVSVGAVSLAMTAEIANLANLAGLAGRRSALVFADASCHCPELLSSRGVLKTYSIYNAPIAIQSIYSKIGVIVMEVKSRIPRLVYYLSVARAERILVGDLRRKVSENQRKIACKCMLMSNSPLPDFRVQWFDGTRLKYALSSGTLSLQGPSLLPYVWEEEGGSHCVGEGGLSWADVAEGAQVGYLLVGQEAMRMCLEELSSRGGGTGGSPVVIVDEGM